MTAARILTVRQPWAWAIILGGKNVENRVRNIAGDYRGPVLIHVAKAMPTPDEWNAAADMIASITGTGPLIVPPRQLGAIIGVVDLVDSHPVESCIEQQQDGDWLVCSEWAERAGHHLVFADPRALDQPIPYRGALGLRKTEFDVVGDYLVAPWGHPANRECTPMGCEPGCHLEPVGRLVATS